MTHYEEILQLAIDKYGIGDIQPLIGLRNAYIAGYTQSEVNSSQSTASLLAEVERLREAFIQLYRDYKMYREMDSTYHCTRDDEHVKWSLISGIAKKALNNQP